MLTTLVNLPAATTTISEIAAVSGPWFNEFIGFAWIPVSMALGGAIVWFIVDSFQSGADKLKAIDDSGWDAEIAHKITKGRFNSP